MFRHRAKLKAAADPAGPPETAAQRELDEIQALLTDTEQAVRRITLERDRLALHLWLEEGLAQSDIAARLDRVDRGHGGPGISYAAIQKRIHRIRSTPTTLRVDYQTAV